MSWVQIRVNMQIVVNLIHLGDPSQKGAHSCQWPLVRNEIRPPFKSPVTFAPHRPVAIGLLPPSSRTLLGRLFASAEFSMKCQRNGSYSRTYESLYSVLGCVLWLGGPSRLSARISTYIWVGHVRKPHVSWDVKGVISETSGLQIPGNGLERSFRLTLDPPHASPSRNPAG